MRNQIVLVVASLAWLGAVGLGFSALANYENTPGVAADPSSQWPVASHVQRAPKGATLVMLAHPQCPCTRASINELAQLMAECQGKVTANVIFMKPKGFPVNWEKTDLWKNAAAIPGVHVMTDIGGVEAKRFRSSTSGQTLLFNQEGQLQFSGGITASRGHSGDNAGRSSIVSLVNTGTTKHSETFVFGCSLVDSALNR